MTLLGQNVNSYAHEPPSTESPTGAEADEAGGSVGRRRRSTKGPAPPAAPPLRDGFRSKVQPARGSVRFAELMRSLCEEHPEVRFRFTSPHPKDFPDDLLHVLSELPNACLSLHIPAQSGSTKAIPRPPPPQGSHVSTLRTPSTPTIASFVLRQGARCDATWLLTRGLPRTHRPRARALADGEYLVRFHLRILRRDGARSRHVYTVHHVSTWQCAPRAHVAMCPTCPRGIVPHVAMCPTCPRGTGG